MSIRKKLVISGVNLTEGGTLTVFRECLAAAEQCLSGNWDIVAIVHDEALFKSQRTKFLAFKEIKRSWFSRLKFEFFDCRKIAQDLAPDFWLSIHDVTPRIGGVPQATYFHNAAAFYRMSMKDVYYEPKLLLFSLFYRYACAINVKSNRYMIAQQVSLRKKLNEYYGDGAVIVAYPTPDVLAGVCKKQRATRYIYPALPRPFKNIELVLEAWRILEAMEGWRGELVLTIDGTENRYAQMLHRKYGGLRGVIFAGRLSATEMANAYESSDCLVFASKAETWGLPLTEAKRYGLAILAADLPYAHESVGVYDGASFFDVTDSNALAQQMYQLSQGRLQFDECIAGRPADPFAENWNQLFDILLEKAAAESDSAFVDMVG